MSINLGLFRASRRTILLAAMVVIAVGVIAGFVLLNSLGLTSSNRLTGRITVRDSFTVDNARWLEIQVAPHGGTVYAGFCRTRDNVTNMYIIHSTNGGATFSNPVQVNEKPGNARKYCGNALAVSPTGALYVAWVIAHGDVSIKGMHGARDFRIAKSTDGGMSFGPSVAPGPPPVENGHSVERTYVDLAVSGDGTVYASYLGLGIVATDGLAKYDMVDGGTVRIARSTNGGRSFHASVVDDSTCVCCATHATRSPASGQVYFTWRGWNTAYTKQHASYQFPDSKPAVARDIMVAHTLGGNNKTVYSSPQRVQHKHWFINGCPSSGAGVGIDDRGGVHVVYFTGSHAAPDGIGYYYAYSDNKGKTFSIMPLLAGDYVPLVHRGAGVAVDDKGNTWATFITPKPSDGDEQTLNYHGNFAIVHVYVIDKQGRIVAKREFPTNMISQPVISSAGGTTVLAFGDGGSFKILSLSLAQHKI